MRHQETIHPGETSENGMPVIEKSDFLAIEPGLILTSPHLDMLPDGVHHIGTCLFPSGDGLRGQLLLLPTKPTHINTSVLLTAIVSMRQQANVKDGGRSPRDAQDRRVVLPEDARVSPNQ